MAAPDMDNPTINWLLGSGSESEAREALRQLLARNPDINQRITAEETALMRLAVNNKAYSLFKEVLARPDVDVNIKQYWEEGALEKAFRSIDMYRPSPQVVFDLLTDPRLVLSRAAFRNFVQYSRNYKAYVPQILQLFLRKGWRPNAKDYVDADWLGPTGRQLVQQEITKFEAKEKGRQLLNLKLGASGKNNIKSYVLKYTPKISEYLTGFEVPLNVARAKAMKVAGVAGAEEVEARALANWMGDENPGAAAAAAPRKGGRLRKTRSKRSRRRHTRRR